MPNDICQDVLAKIKKEQICPVPRWRFLFQRSFFWSLFIFSLVIGSLAVAVIIFALRTNDWNFYKYVDNNFIKFLLASLPYFWIIVMAVFIGLAYLNYRRTNGGYRHRFYGIVGLSLLSSVLLGYGIDKIGAGEDMEEAFFTNVGPYRQMIIQRESVWSNPEQGRLSGIVISVNDPANFNIVDFHDKKWAVIRTDFFQIEKEELEIQEKIRLIGKMLDETTFEASMIRPWGCHMHNICFGR
jgi:hypothetical protein